MIHTSKELEMSGGPLTRNDENVGQPARNRARKQASLLLQQNRCDTDQ
jgi:hypothetical protein